MSNLGSLTLSEYLSALSARKSTPGGGAVAAIVAAEACALIGMVAEFSKDLKTTSALAKQDLEQLLALADEDSLAFKAVMQTYKDKSDPQEALQRAATVPLDVLQLCERQIGALDALLEHGNKNLITDTAIAASLLQSAINACVLNIQINANSMSKNEKTKLIEKLDHVPDLLAQLVAVQNQISISLQQQ